jgi:hypothetical protein
MRDENCPHTWAVNMNIEVPAIYIQGQDGGCCTLLTLGVDTGEGDRISSSSQAFHWTATRIIQSNFPQWCRGLCARILVRSSLLH